MTATGICDTEVPKQAISLAFDRDGNFGILCLDGSLKIYEKVVDTSWTGEIRQMIPKLVSMEFLESYMVIAAF